MVTVRGRPRGAPGDRPGRRHDLRPGPDRLQRLRGQALVAAARQRRRAARAARRRRVRPDHPHAGAVAQRASTPRTPRRSSRRSATCASWPATSPPATSPPPPCGAGSPAPRRTGPDAPRPGRSHRMTALARTSRSSRPASTAARTSGPTRRRSTSWSTSGRWRSSRPTRCPGFTDNLLQMLPGLREHSCSRGRRGGFVERLQRGHLARPRRRAHRAGAPAGRRPRHPARQDPAGQGRPGHYNVIFGYVDEKVAPGRRRARRTPGQPPGRGGPRARLGRGARELHPAGRAHRLRPVHPGDRRRGRLAGHPVDPAQPVLPRPARPGRPRQADPGHDDVGDLARSPSTSPPTRTSPPGCSAPPACPVPKQESVRTADQAVTRRPSGSASRSWSSRSTATTAAACASNLQRRRGRPRGLPDRRGAVPARHGHRRVAS